MNGCLEWYGVRNDDGYGTIGYRSRTWLVHRLVWTLKHGDIPDGINICHTCDNPACINPDHLFAGTQAENVTDMVRKGRNRSPGRRGEKNHSAKLSEGDIASIRSELASRCHSKDGTTKRLADQFGVSESTISHIGKKKRWQHL